MNIHCGAKEMMEETNGYYVQKLREIFQGCKGKRILDVGCSRGWVLSPFTHENYIVGIDINVWAKEAISRGFKEAHVFDVEGKWPSVGTLNQPFDIILSSQVIEHLTFVNRYLHEMHSRLSDDGKCIVSTINHRTPQSLLYFLLMNKPPPGYPLWDNFHTKVFSSRLLGECLEKSGFTVLKMIGTSFHDHFPGIAHYFPSIASDVIAICEKS